MYPVRFLKLDNQIKYCCSRQQAQLVHRKVVNTTYTNEQNN